MELTKAHLPWHATSFSGCFIQKWLYMLSLICMLGLTCCCSLKLSFGICSSMQSDSSCAFLVHIIGILGSRQVSQYHEHVLGQRAVVRLLGISPAFAHHTWPHTCQSRHVPYVVTAQHSTKCPNFYRNCRTVNQLLKRQIALHYMCFIAKFAWFHRDYELGDSLPGQVRGRDYSVFFKS